MEKKLPEYVYMLVPEDVQFVLDERKRFLQEVINDSSSSEERVMESKKELEQYESIDFIDLCEFIHRKMDIPWTEYISAAISCYVNYRKEV